MDGTPAEDDSDAELIQRFRGGDERAFTALYRRHEGALFRFVYRQLHDHACAKDLTQEVWFTVARSAARYREQQRFRPWLYTLTRHRVIDYRRQRRPHLMVVATADEAESAQVPAGAASSPETQLESAQAHAQLLAAVTQLPFEQREAFLLLAEAELSLEDIATVTAVNAETVKSRLRYARQKLRQWLPEPT